MRADGRRRSGVVDIFHSILRDRSAGRCRHAGSQGIDLFSHYAGFHYLLHYMITIHLRYRWTDRRYARGISWHANMSR